jgi:pimeloyl-ACP methyl ester carboxylesterase
MAEDIREIMDFNKIEKAHILGWSMGGMIAQRLAIGYPHRIKSLICMMSSGGTPKLNNEIIKLFCTPPKSKRFEDRVQRVMAIHKKIMSPKYPISDHELRLHVEKSMRYSKEGGKSGLGVANQCMAINVDNSRFKLLHRITAPTLVLHGEEDVVIYVSDAIALAKAISGSRLITYPGMGHDFPAVLIPKFIEEITNHIKTASLR